MDTLYTATLVFFTVLNGAILFLAYREARAAEAAESRIEKSLARLAGVTPRVSAVEAAIEGLRLQHQKLHGKFHAKLREWDELSEARWGDDELQGGDRTPEPPIGAPCENYLAAQVEGPHSAAAQCQCAYCLRKRAERDALRQKLPKGSHADRVRAIEAAS